MPRRQLGGFAQQGGGMSNKRRVDYSRVAELAAARQGQLAKPLRHFICNKKPGLIAGVSQEF